MQTKIDAVVFDFDNTLTNTSKSIIRARKDVLAYIRKNHNITEKAYMEALQSAGDELKSRKYKDNAKLYDLLSEYAGLGLSKKETKECRRIFTESMLSHMEFPKNIKKLFEWIKSRGLKIGILTDNAMFPGSEYKKKRLANLPAIDMVDIAVIATQTIPESKDTPKSFVKTAKMLGVSANKILYVGDRPDKDIDNAKKAGMVAVLFEGFSKAQHNENLSKPDYTITDLSELLKIIREHIDG